MPIVPHVTGKCLAPAIAELVSAGFDDHDYQIDGDGPADPAQHGGRKVLSQDPGGDTDVPVDTVIELVVEDG